MDLEHDFTVPVSVDQAWRVLLDVERIAPCMPGATLDSVDGDEFTGRLKVRLGAMTITYRGKARITSRDEESRTVTIEGSGKEARGSGTAGATIRARLHAEGDVTRVSVRTTLNVTGRPAQFGRNILSEVGAKLIDRFAGNLADELTRDEPSTSASAQAAAGPSEPAPAATTAEEETAGTAPGESAEGAEGPDQATASARDESPKAASAAGAGAAGGDGQAQVGVEGGTPREPAASKRPARAPAGRSEAEAIDLLEVAGSSIAKRIAPLFAGLAALWALRRLLRRSRR
jgi:carbon monoxide dehydrogenase subunit G